MPDQPLGLLDIIRGFMQQRQQSDMQTQQFVSDIQRRFPDPMNAWQYAMETRELPQFFNNPQMRNAEHYLSAAVPQNTFGYGMLAAPYLATKLFDQDPMGFPMVTPQTQAQAPDPMGELKWGMLPMLQSLGLAR